jgi:hypothetical protein
MGLVLRGDLTKQAHLDRALCQTNCFSSGVGVLLARSSLGHGVVVEAMLEGKRLFEDAQTFAKHL